MNDLTITVTGWVATTPAFVVRRDGKQTDMVTFRVAQTPRRFDSAQGKWVDKKTEWFDIRVHGATAVFIEKSVHKGDPVIVTGRLQTDEWATSDGANRFALQVNASSVGHDLSRGIARFSRAVVEAGEIVPVLSKAASAAAQDGAEDTATDGDAQAGSAGDAEAADVIDAADVDVDDGVDGAESDVPEDAGADSDARDRESVLAAS